MRILTTLGALAGGFFMSPSSVVLALLWLGARSHPAVTVVAVVAVALAWMADHD